MNAALRLAYRRIPSFRREDGGTYALYAAINSRAHAARARSRHRRGLHTTAPHGTGPCTWCGHPLGSPR